MIQTVETFEKALIESSLLQNSTSPVEFKGETFAVVAQLTCFSNETGFPGRSFFANPDMSDLNIRVEQQELDTDLAIVRGEEQAGVNLPNGFAVPIEGGLLSPKNATSFENTSSACEKPVAVIFHAFNNSNLFQSAAGRKDNLVVNDSQLLLGDVLGVVNSLVVSATLSSGLNTDELAKDAELLFEEAVPMVS